MDLKSLREQRGKIVNEMDSILSKAKSEGRDLTAEEAAKHGDLFKKQDEVRVKIEAEERQVELNREMTAQAAVTDAVNRAAQPGTVDPAEIRSMSELLKRDVTEQDCILYRKQVAGYRSYILNGDSGNPEFRALQVDTDTAGGFITPPEQTVQQLLKNVDDLLWVRQVATKFQVPAAESLGVPTLTNPGAASWTSEIQTAPEDSTMAFGKRALHPHPMSKLIKVSNPLMRKAVMPVESLVNDRFAYVFGTTEETAFMTGTGSQQPLGVFTASADGVPTSRDFGTASGENSTTAITFNGLIAVKYSLKAQYWPKAKWVFHRDAMKMISKLVDGNGQYLWRPSTIVGEPDTILGHPIMVSEYAPNTFTTGLYVGMLADFSYYWIADALSMGLQRLVELYAATNQTGFIGRLEVDGMPVLAEAFSRVTLA